MGKGDKKSKRGKIAIGSSGVSRKRKKAKKVAAPKVKAKPVAKEKVKKAPAAKKPKKEKEAPSE